MNGYDNSVPFVNYKALESLLIEGEKMIATESNSIPEAVKVSFFGKTWDNVGISYHSYSDLDVNKVIKQINAFVNQSSKLSKEIEPEFCKAFYKKLNEHTKAYPINKYSDAKPIKYVNPAIQLKSIHPVYLYDRKNKKETDKVGLIISGEWAADEEHGWSFGWHDGKWNHEITEFIDYLDLFILFEDKYNNYQVHQL